METGKQTAFWGAVGTVGAAVVLWVITPVGEYVEGSVRSFLSSQFGDPGNSSGEGASARDTPDTGSGERATPPSQVTTSGSDIIVDAKGTGGKSSDLALGISTAVAAKLGRSSVIDRIEYEVGRQSATSPRTAAIGLVLFAGGNRMDCGEQTVAFRSSAELATKIAERANIALTASQQGDKLVCS